MPAIHSAKEQQTSPTLAMVSASNRCQIPQVFPRGGPVGINDLPPELLLPILTTLAKSHQFRCLAVLATSCRTLYHKTMPYIYKDVHLHSQKAYDALLRGLERPGSSIAHSALPGRSTGEKEGRSEEGGRGELLRNLEFTERITLGYAPDTEYGVRVRQVLNSLFPEDTVPVLFPNAKLLQIAFAPCNKGFGDYPVTPISFLSSFCRPQQVCFDENIGHPELRRQVSPDCSPFIDIAAQHLPPSTWSGPDLPEMSWHGPIAKWFMPVSSETQFAEPRGQRFRSIRVYALDTYEACDRACTEGSSGSHMIGFCWASAFYRLCTRYLRFTFTKNRTPSAWTINISTAEPSGAEVRFRPNFLGQRDSVTMTRSTAKASLASCASGMVEDWQMKERLLKLWEVIEEGTWSSKLSDEDIMGQMVQAQQLLDEALDGAELMDKEGVMEMLVQEAKACPYTAWAVGLDEEGKETLANVDVRIGTDQVPCPVCEYHPY